MSDRFLKPAKCLDRRAMLWRCLGLAAAGRILAADTPPRFRKLKRPVALPLEALAQPGRPVPFTARCAKSGSGSEMLLKGIALRLPAPGTKSPAEALRAFCLSCPHEQCEVNTVDDTRAGHWPAAARRQHLMLVCPCHFSLFDPLAEGAVLAGPAARGLYLFGFTIQGKRIIIREIEEAALA